jgi:hypothetical protein
VYHHRYPEYPPVIAVVFKEALVPFMLHQVARYFQARDAATGREHQQAAHQIGNAEDEYQPGHYY